MHKTSRSTYKGTQINAMRWHSRAENGHSREMITRGRSNEKWSGGKFCRISVKRKVRGNGTAAARSLLPFSRIPTIQRCVQDAGTWVWEEGRASERVSLVALIIRTKCLPDVEFAYEGGDSSQIRLSHWMISIGKLSHDQLGAERERERCGRKRG